MTEQIRLEAFTNNEAAPRPSLHINVSQLANPEQCFSKLKEVMQSTLDVPTELWQEDFETSWQNYLPSWFVKSMTTLTVEQIIAMPDQWHFESWVSTMCARQWEWWSSKLEADSLHINLELQDLPYNFEPLLYAIRASCDNTCRIEVEEQF